MSQLREKLLIFKVLDTKYAINVLDVMSIDKYNKEITKLPNTPEHIKGLIVIREKPVNLVDLNILFDSHKSEKENKQHNTNINNKKIIVVQKEIEEKLIAFLVDEVQNVIDIDAEVQDCPINISYIKGIILYDQEPIMLLDIDKLIEII